MDKTASAVALDCELIARARIRVPVGDLAKMRSIPGPNGTVRVPATFLKQSDDQTILGLTTVFRAIDDYGLDASSFDDWGVLGVPSAFGRAAVAVALQKYAEEGAWGVSPHLIPHRSLHSLSGTISHALKIHGPNLGVGGGPDGPGEALLVAASMLAQGVPGVWLVMTRHDPDVPPESTGAMPAGTHLLCIILGLKRAREPRHHTNLRIEADTKAFAPGLTIQTLSALLNEPDGGIVHFSGGRLELRPSTLIVSSDSWGIES